MEGCGFRDLYDAFRVDDVRIVGVSFDAPADNRAWAMEQKFPFELWTDHQRNLARVFGAATTSDATYPGRVTVLLDEQGQVLKRWDVLNPGGHPKEVLTFLQETAHKQAP